MNRDAQQNVIAEQYAARERRRILAEEPDSDLAIQFRQEDADAQKSLEAEIAQREGEEREQQQQRDYETTQELSRAQENLNERGRRVNFMLLFGAANYPHLKRSPE